MAASQENPVYTVYLVDGNNKYNITPAVVSIGTSNQEKQLAQSVDLTLLNIKTSTGKTLCELLTVRRRVFVYADDGEKKDEVFRGWTWTRYHQSTLEESALKIKCYDNLIYLQESESSYYYSKGKSTKAVMKDIANNWGIKIKYSYSSITNPKLVLRGTLSDMIISDILNPVKNRTGTKYTIYSQKDVMYVAPVGSNTKIYKIESKNNAVEVKSEKTMDGMVTKVKILGSAEKSGKVPVAATVKGDTKKYGTLQKIITKDSDDSLSDAKKEANAIIQVSGKPFEESYVTAPDIPWIKKGDMVYVNAGHISKKELIVAGIERDISNKKKVMTLTLTKPKATKISTKTSTTASGNAGELLAQAKDIFAEMNSRGFKYSNASKDLADSWSGAKKKKKSNCATAVSWAMQEAGLIPKGDWFWLGGKKVHYRSGLTASELKKNCSISYPNKSPKKAGLEPGDVCGYTNHTQIFAGWNKKGEPTWYSFGTSDVGKKMPRVKSSYNSRKIEVLIRPK